MSVTSISSTSLFNYQTPSIPNQQPGQREFHKLGQELQFGNLSAPQAVAQTRAQTELGTLQPASPSNVTGSQSSVSTAQLRHALGTPRHVIHVHAHPPHRLSPDPGNESDSAAQQADPLGRIQSVDSSTVQQAYGAWQQDLLQGGLNQVTPNLMASISA